MAEDRNERARAIEAALAQSSPWEGALCRAMKVGKEEIMGVLAAVEAWKKYDLAVNMGLAGTFRDEINIGEVVNVVTDCFADLGAEDGTKFLTLNQLGLQVQRLIQVFTLHCQGGQAAQRVD